MSVTQTVNVTIDNTDKQEQAQKQKQDVSAVDDNPGNSLTTKPNVTKKPVKDVK